MLKKTKNELRRMSFFDTILVLCGLYRLNQFIRKRIFKNYPLRGNQNIKIIHKVKSQRIKIVVAGTSGINK